VDNAAASSASTPPASGSASDKKLIVEYLNDCCVAILCLIRQPLLSDDFLLDSIALEGTIKAMSSPLPLPLLQRPLVAGGHSGHKQK